MHRGGENSMDISADLIELGKTPMAGAAKKATAVCCVVATHMLHPVLTTAGSAVVCAGIKSVLDIPRTLEFLETQGVTVASFGAGQLDTCTIQYMDML